ncbi:MAG: lipoyl synthase [Deltaproteobacteria bacterium]|nr:MAG: lipoyl synthase [Deltaproteobacteria bacterium]
MRKLPTTSGSNDAEKEALAEARRIASIWRARPDHRPRLPSWFKVPLPAGEGYQRLKASMRELKLATVCEEARCPNIGECWNGGTATVMILGDTCTRACRFCAVRTGDPKGRLDPEEPEHVAEAVARMGIDYVVITSVDRDDLPDLGAEHYARCIEAVKARTPWVRVEVLTPDFQGRREAVERIVAAGPDVFAHNVETVRRLHRRVRDARAKYTQSLEVLEAAKAAGVPFTKSGLMLGVGEREDEVLECMRDLRAVGVELLTLGQYLRPSRWHIPVERFWTPQAFERLRVAGEAMGFAYVASGPLVRSSYRAGEFFVGALLDARHPIPARPRRSAALPILQP